MKTPGAWGAGEVQDPLGLMEDAWHLVRRAPWSALLAHGIGTWPFVLALLYFVSDMSRSALAADRLGVGAMGLALLFVWMKCWQSVYAQRLRDLLSGQPPARWDAARVRRLVAAQGALQPLGFFMMPVALALLLPFGWTYAYFSNATVLGDGADPGLRTLGRRIWRQSLLWPQQNHVVLLTYQLLAVFLMLNLGLALALGPALAKSLLGVETVFSQSPWSMLNTTFFASLLGLSYVCLDPFVKATYVLRCFYGESLQSALDLRADLERFRGGGSWEGWAMGLALTILLAGLSTHALASSQASDVPPPTVMTQRIDATELDRSISDIIQKRAYSWRLPRQRPLPEQNRPDRSGFLAWFDKLGRGLSGFLDDLGSWFRGLRNWVWPKPGSGWERGGPGYDWSGGLRGLLLVLVLVLGGLLALLLWRSWQRRRWMILKTAAATALTQRPSLEDETVSADQLPEDAWMKLARELAGRGESRLALRAFYLASLAHLAECNLITLARFKSNRDYERELGRRAHALPWLAELFRDMVTRFERVWYGLHEVTGDGLTRFAAQVEKLRRESAEESQPPVASPIHTP